MQFDKNKYIYQGTTWYLLASHGMYTDVKQRLFAQKKTVSKFLNVLVLHYLTSLQDIIVAWDPQ